MVHIYLLTDPTDSKKGYAGKTARKPEERFRFHLRNKDKTYKANWIQKLIRAKLKPILTIIEVVDDALWDERERYWIKYYRELGYELTNLTEGGGGQIHSIKREYTVERRNKISQSLREHYSDPENKLKAGRASKKTWETRSRVMPEEVKRKISETKKAKSDTSWNKDKKWDQSVKDKISKKKRGSKWGNHTEETKAKMSAWIIANRKPMSDETKQKISATLKKRNSSKAVCVITQGSGN